MLEKKIDPFQTMNILGNNLVIRMETVTWHGGGYWSKNIKYWLHI